MKSTQTSNNISLLRLFAGINLNPVPDNARIPPNTDYNPPRGEVVNPNNVFGFPNVHNNYPQMPPQQIPLDIPRLPDNKQAFPASPNSGGGFAYNPSYHPAPTPPPNVFGPYRPPYVTSTSGSGLIDQLLKAHSTRSTSTINIASLNLMLCSLLFLFYYRIRLTNLA